MQPAVVVKPCPIESYVEVVRLDGNLTSVTATPEIPVHPGNATQQDLTPGDRYVVSGQRLSLAWRWLRETTQNAQLTINSRGYSAGSGPVYLEKDYSESANNGYLTHVLDFVASPGAFIEIVIEREVA